MLIEKLVKPAFFLGLALLLPAVAAAEPTAQMQKQKEKGRAERRALKSQAKMSEQEKMAHHHAEISEAEATMQVRTPPPHLLSSEPPSRPLRQSSCTPAPGR